jgi:hypothetical protein
LGGWVRQCDSLVVAALWAEHLGVAALGRLCVDNSTGVEKEWLQGHLLGGGIGVGEGAPTNHIGSGAPVENGGIQRRTCQKLL